MIDDVSGYECWLIDSEGNQIPEVKNETVVEASPPISTRVKAVSTSRLSRSGGSVASTSTSVTFTPPYAPFAAPPYKQERVNDPYTSALRIIRCYVEVVPRSNFAIHFQETEQAPPHALAVEVLVDGRFVRGRFVRRGNSCKVDFNICRRTGEGSPVTSPLEFPDFREIEDTLGVADDELGTVCVDIWRGSSRSSRPSDTLCNIMTTADAEDVLTPRPVRGLPPVYLRGGTAFDPLMNFEFEERLVRFEFRYRTEAFLRAYRIKPVAKPKALKRESSTLEEEERLSAKPKLLKTKVSLNKRVCTKSI